MLVTFVLGVVAALALDRAAPRVKAMVERALPGDGAIEGTELRLLTLAGTLFVAAVLAELLDGGSGAVLTLGALVGLAWPRLRLAIRGRGAASRDRTDV